MLEIKENNILDMLDMYGEETCQEYDNKLKYFFENMLQYLWVLDMIEARKQIVFTFRNVGQQTLYFVSIMFRNVQQDTLQYDTISFRNVGQ